MDEQLTAWAAELKDKDKAIDDLQDRLRSNSEKEQQRVRQLVCRQS
jgi:hypothetical protein